MDDILASIRRILSEEEKAAKAQTAPDNVLVLDPSMMVAEPEPTPQSPPPPPPSQEVHAMSEPTAPPPSPSHVPEPSGLPGEQAALVAPEAAAAAASSVSQLMRTLASERNAAIHRGGPTLEDLVREEIRPMLKQWLDANLPPLVERLVRVEIERVVARMAP
jgi:cell pole-organizing protein PopZ